MLINIFLIAIAIAITILSTTKLKKNEDTKWHKKLTRNGIIFYIAILSAIVFQVIKEFQNSKREDISINKINNLTDNLDSVKRIAFYSSDTIGNLKDSISKLIRVIDLIGDKSSSIESKSGSIERQLYLTDKKVSLLGKTNDSLNKKIFESDRPILSLVSAEITNNKSRGNNHFIDFKFISEGKRPVTNLYGKAYSMYRDTVSIIGTLPVSRSDVFTNQKVLIYSLPMDFDPDSTSIENPIFYYFKLSYSDLILNTSYSLDIAMKMNPFEKGKYLTFLVNCPNWEIAKMKRTIERGYVSGNK
jgi:hypothetical protein